MSKMTKTIAILGVVAGLGVAALPLGSYAAGEPAPVDSQAVPLSLTVAPMLEISTNMDNDASPAKTVELTTTNATAAGGNAEYASSGFNVNVKTNNTAGYTIGIKATAAGNVNMVSGDNKIPSAALTTGTSAWAFKTGTLTSKGVTAAGAEGSTGTSTATSWTAVTATSTPFYTATQEAGGISTAGIDTPVIFGATVAPNQAAGTYTTSVTFTATATPAP